MSDETCLIDVGVQFGAEAYQERRGEIMAAVETLVDAVAPKGAFPSEVDHLRRILLGMARAFFDSTKGFAEIGEPELVTLGRSSLTATMQLDVIYNGKYTEEQMMDLFSTVMHCLSPLMKAAVGVTISTVHAKPHSMLIHMSCFAPPLKQQ